MLTKSTIFYQGNVRKKPGYFDAQTRCLGIEYLAKDRGGDLMLDRAKVRPIQFDEREKWQSIMSRQHYPGHAHPFGNTIYYVAERESRWLALIGFPACALKCKPRDVTFNEDKSKNRKKKGQEIMANIRHLCINMMRLLGIKNIDQGTRDFMMDPKLVIDLMGC